MRSPPVRLKRIQSCYFGGSLATVSGLPIREHDVVPGAGSRPVDMNGRHAVGQLYAMQYEVEEPVSPYPVLLWHGGGLCGAQWEATPDGRSGWLWRFLQAGWTTWICDAPERGRASWAMYPEIYHGPPLFRSIEEAWSLFRIGPPGAGLAALEPYAGQRFPYRSIEQFARQFVPRWPGHEQMASAAYDALIAATGPCIVIGHSQGGGFAAHAAQRHPSTVKAVVGLEPTGLPSSPASAAGLPHLQVWGDFLEHDPLWQRYRDSADQYWNQLAARGVRAETLDLPAAGVRGNSHCCMHDLNSDAIADQIIAWLATVGHEP